MIDLLSQHHWVKWILIGFGILYVLDKYFGFSPVDSLIDRIGRYKFKEFTHLHNTQLKQLIEDFNNNKFTKVDESLNNFNQSYRSFGFKCLGQYGDIEAAEEWIKSQENNSTPQIIKGYQLIHKAWEIRGRGSIDTVSKSDLSSFKNYLKVAEQTFLEAQKHSSGFKSNIFSSLLKIYKASNVDRTKIQQIFDNGDINNSNDAEINFNYFSTISFKWGGTQEEFDNYFNSLEKKSPFIKNLILAQYYFDLVHMEGDNDDDGKIQNFIERSKILKIEENELYKYEFYLLLYWLSNNLKLKQLETYYKKLIEPYWED